MRNRLFLLHFVLDMRSTCGRVGARSWTAPFRTPVAALPEEEPAHARDQLLAHISTPSLLWRHPLPAVPCTRTALDLPGPAHPLARWALIRGVTSPRLAPSKATRLRAWSVPSGTQWKEVVNGCVGSGMAS